MFPLVSARRALRISRMREMLLGLCICTSATAAAEPRPLCPDRPGLGTPACTVAPGVVVGELGLADWTRDTTTEARSDALIAGSLLVRVGLTETLEAQLGWDAAGHVRTRDRQSGAVARAARPGDITLALRRNLRNPDGTGFALAVMPYATLPAGRAPVGAGDWGAGVSLPVSVALTDALSLAFTPQFDAAVDGDGAGRHLGFGTVTGLGFALSDTVGVATELALYRDRDPDGASTAVVGGLSAGWQPTDTLQFDIGVNIGLTATSPDAQIYFGVATRF